MPTRDFIDRKGVAWQVWDVTAEAMHPKTKAEDYMAEMADGWLVFETPDGTAKRRLCPYPQDWVNMTRSQLEELCERASLVVRRPMSRSRAAQLVDELTQSSEQVARGRTTRRTFTTPTGRVWQAFLFERSTGERVLRFTTENLVLDLDRWPDDWERYEDAQLAMLVLDASPPQELRIPGEQPQREADDLQP